MLWGWNCYASIAVVRLSAEPEACRKCFVSLEIRDSPKGLFRVVRLYFMEKMWKMLWGWSIVKWCEVGEWSYFVDLKHPETTLYLKLPGHASCHLYSASVNTQCFWKDYIERVLLSDGVLTHSQLYTLWEDQAYLLRPWKTGWYWVPSHRPWGSSIKPHSKRRNMRGAKSGGLSGFCELFGVMFLVCFSGFLWWF